MNMDYCKPYAGRDTVILDRHAADTIAEDIRAFDSQLENHFAHVIMLAEQKIITRQDAAAILKALLKLKEMGPDKIPFRPGLTDLYSNVEEWLIDELGIQVGGRVHTGRSRNDMNSTIERMHTRRTILDLCEAGDGAGAQGDSDPCLHPPLPAGAAHYAGPLLHQLLPDVLP